MKIETEIIRSNRKTLSIEIRPNGSLLVRAPKRMSNKEIDSFLDEKQDWIIKHIEKQRRISSAATGLKPYTRDELNYLADEALEYIPDRVSKYASEIGVTYGRITIRSQKTRWGSCSEKGNLNFNCLLMLLPEDVRDYVIIHELCHRKEMNHSPAFWQEVAKYCPEYKELRKILKDKGEIIMSRLR